MSTRLDTSDPVLKTALAEIANPSNPNDWVVFGYTGKTNKLKVDAKGNGFQDMVEEFNEGKVQFGYWRQMVKNAPKFVYIVWCGEGVEGMQKGNSANHANDFNSYMKTVAKTAIHVQINARNETDLDEEKIKAKLVAAGGANYDAGAKRQGASEGAGAVGMSDLKDVHVKAIQGSEFKKESVVLVDKQASEEFWKQNQSSGPEKPAQGQSQSNLDAAARQKFWDEQKKAEEEEKARQAQASQSKPRFQVSKEESQQYWDQQKPTSNAPPPTAGSTKSAQPKVASGNSSSLKSRFEQKAQEASQPVQKPPGPAPKKFTPKPATPAPAPVTPSPAKTTAPPPKPAPAPVPTKTVAPPVPVTAAPPKPAPPPPQPVYVPEPEPEPVVEPAQEEYAQEEYQEEAQAQEEYQEEYASTTGQEEYAQEEYASTTGQEEYAQEEYQEEAQAQEEYQEEYASTTGQEEYAQEEYQEEAQAQSEYICVVEAAYQYAGERAEDLSFNAGDFINVIEQDASGWWKGELNGAVGYFPSNFVKSS